METMQCDYLVIGAGSAGCVVAGTLATVPSAKVLVLEAGGSDNRLAIRMPAGFAMTFADPRVNWCYEGAADPGLNNRKSFIPRGKVVGGSGSINAMAYVRGLPQDFDDWASAGATGWGWKDVKPVFEALETHICKGADDAPPHGGRGSVVVSDLSDKMHPFSAHFRAAATEMGWPVAHSIGQSADGAGLAHMPSMVKQGRRWSTADAFLRPALKQKNLQLITHAHVECLTFDGRRVTGAIFRRGQQRKEVSVSKEVILCAGAINTPKILQISGVGPPDLLRNHGIQIRHAMPEVGRGFQDHLALTLGFKATMPTLNSSLGTRTRRIVEGIRYLAARAGPLALPVNQYSGFVRSDAALNTPDLQVYCNPILYGMEHDARTMIGAQDGYMLSVQPCRPQSRGMVEITSSDTEAAPRIFPNSLTHDADQRSAVAAVQNLLALSNTSSLRNVTRTSAGAVPDKLQKNESLLDKDALLNQFRQSAHSVYHASCTCRIGQDAANSVVDPSLRLHGLSGLRVIDASVFPNITSGNTNAPTIMVAKRGADMIVQNR